MKIEMPYPISANRYWRIFGKNIVRSAEATAYRERVAWSNMRVKPFNGSVSVYVTLHPRLTTKGEASKTLIDLDNGLKVTIDSLQGVAYHNDKQVKRIIAEYGEPIKNGGTTVIVEALG